MSEKTTGRKRFSFHLVSICALLHVEYRYKDQHPIHAFDTCVNTYAVSCDVRIYALREKGKGFVISYPIP